MRTSIKEIRRRDLAEAALETLKEYGFSRTTVAKVAERAQMSPGIVHHYFKNKEELLEATVRYTTDELRRAVVRYLRRARTPHERLVAIIEGQLAPEMFDVGAAQVWISYLGQVPFVERYARLQRVLYRRLHSNLMRELKRLVPEARAQYIAEQLSILIDGVWVRLAVAEGPISREVALEKILTYLESEIPRPETGAGREAS